MKKTWLTLAFAAASMVVLGTLTAAAAAEQGSNPPGGDIALFKAVLEEAGFTVQEGAYGYQDAIALCSAGLIENCMGANVEAPYLAYKLPQAPGQKTPSMKVDPASGLAFAYPMRNDEAVVQIGRTPPESAFFSYQSYLTMRYDPGLGRHKAFFNSIGDTINNLTININRAAESPFNQPVMIISTADQGIDRRVRAAAQSAGYSSEMINTDVIPSSVVTMGLEGRVDLFGFVSRVAVPGDKSKLDAYIKNPGSVVLRLTPKEAATPDPFPAPALRVRGTGKTELDLLPAVEDLRRAILARHENLEALEIPACVALPEGFNAIQSGINTIGDNRDAAYFSTIEVDAWTKPDDSRRAAGFVLPDSPEDFLIIYGVNHEAAGKALYANSVVYGLPYLNGVASVDSRTYQNSAVVYLPDHPQARYLYAWKIARNSHGDPHCLEVPVGPQRYGIALDEKILLFFRAYLEAATKVGPAHNELITDRLIIFSPKK
ncbi:MAG: hypothetical protein IT188_09190 [Acidobacteria bacterium]|nr:hypothetical protein [Acidobacteriota bacterium]